MIEIGGGIDIGTGITMGDVTALATFFVTEVTEDYLISETDQNFILE